MVGVSGPGQIQGPFSQNAVSAVRTGGGQTEPPAKGGNTSDPVDIGAVTGGATSQIATQQEQTAVAAKPLQLPGTGVPATNGSSGGAAGNNQGVEGKKGGKVNLYA